MAIRRRIEYIITCDCERVFGYLRCDGFANAFNSDTAKDCATVAESEGWKRLGGRTWLSPKCAEIHAKEKWWLNSPPTEHPATSTPKHEKEYKL